MKRLLSTLLIIISSVAYGQNNPYDLTDECYKLFLRADSMIGKEGFESANDSLLKAAVANSDDKARVMYYVLDLRRLIRNPQTTDEEVLEAQERLKEIALQTGYRQYFYQSYEYTKNYFFNTNRILKAVEIIREMQREAVSRDDAYGKWCSAREFSAIYGNYGDRNTQRHYLTEIINTYNNSDDPLIRRQTIAPAYIDYANTFPPRSDSLRYFVHKAWSLAKTPQDSVRCAFQLAIIGALSVDYAEYAKWSEIYDKSPFRNAVTRYAPRMLDITDALFAGSITSDDRRLYNLPTQNARTIAKIAENMGRHDIAEPVKDYCLDTKNKDFAELLDMQLLELDAQYGNDLLAADLAEKSEQVARIKRAIEIIFIIVLLAGLVLMFLYVRSLKRREARDAAMIEELREANERARIADAAKDRFIQNMTHELRTPLNAITGFSQLLAMPDGMFSPEEKEEFGHHVINGTRMMTMLLDDIMSASAMDSSGYRLIEEETDCEAVCREAMTSAEHRLRSGVNLVFTPRMDLPFGFRSDPLRIQQVLTNLLTNACKHTASGEIRLGCSLEEIPGMLTFFVEDTGPGIPPEEAEHIFERFVKLDEFVQGTGLGLSICREIAVKMGGKVYLDTSYSGGSRFVFCVPLTAQTAGDITPEFGREM